MSILIDKLITIKTKTMSELYLRIRKDGNYNNKYPYKITIYDKYIFKKFEENYKRIGKLLDKTEEEFINIIIERTLKSYKETLEHEIEYIDYSLIKTEYDI